MRKVLLVLGMLSLTLSAAYAADRIFTNPKPDAHLRKLFPKAVAFSKLEGTPLHFKAYGEDPKVNPKAAPIGYGFWTTDIMPNERGYHAAMHFLVGLDPQGVITGVVLDYDSEPYGYFSIQPPEFVAQFTNKSLRDPFKLGQDIDAVSRATVTMSAAVRVIRDSARSMARQFLMPPSTRP